MANKLTKPAKNIFLVSRTSIYDDDVKPCDEAVEIYVKNIDSRAVDDPSKLVWKPTADTWYDTGTNHRVENGKIKRDFGERKEWAIKTNNIFDFVKKYGSCIINIDVDGFNTIEIYDDYRE